MKCPRCGGFLAFDRYDRATQENTYVCTRHVSGSRYEVEVRVPSMVRPETSAVLSGRWGQGAEVQS